MDAESDSTATSFDASGVTKTPEPPASVSSPTTNGSLDGDAQEAPSRMLVRAIAQHPTRMMREGDGGVCAEDGRELFMGRLGVGDGENLRGLRSIESMESGGYETEVAEARRRTTRR
ncbi:hypothetical protein AKJ09_02013 [Labilithrix luteola]|uniref:Uncharacterized protein n=1 Tax=Labilithrix luteola TaxID=1391654 RepID=A0A0K1PQF8_9BACT|nr:hypothetical protein AKJ09_02013 [Labilithrix luteola]